MNYKDYDTLAIYQLLLKNLFLSIARTRFYILLTFFGNDTLNGKLKFYWKKEKLTNVAPRRFEVTLI